MSDEGREDGKLRLECACFFCVCVCVCICIDDVGLDGLDFIWHVLFDAAAGGGATAGVDIWMWDDFDDT